MGVNAKGSWGEHEAGKDDAALLLESLQQRSMDHLTPHAFQVNQALYRLQWLMGLWPLRQRLSCQGQDESRYACKHCH